MEVCAGARRAFSDGIVHVSTSTGKLLVARDFAAGGAETFGIMLHPHRARRKKMMRFLSD
jgi:hypothetical protein